MKRFLIALSAIVLVSSIVFLVFFSASKYRVKGKPYFHSLSDFIFMVGTYNAQGLGLEPRKLTDGNYERVMGHARPNVHYEVKRRIIWSLTRWGEEVAPRLVHEIEQFSTPKRVSVAATALGQLHHFPALASIVEAFERTSSNRRFQVGLIDALADLGPEASPFLIETYRSARAKGEEPHHNLLDAIGRSGGGVEFLIMEVGRAENADQILELEWPLAMTRDPRAARALVSLLHHPRLGVRRRARDSMSQSMGDVAVEPVVDLLETETDDFVRSWVISQILASRNASGSPRAVELLGKLLDDPVVGDDANYALTRIGTERAIELLRNQIRHKSPRWVMNNLGYTGTVSLRIFEDYLHHPEPAIRRSAVRKIMDLQEPEAIQVLGNYAEEPDPRTKDLIRSAIFQMDLLLLAESFAEWWSEKTGKAVWRIRLPRRKGFRVALSTLSFFHWVGLGISIVLGLLLLGGGLRAFEHYKFALTIQFLLVLGIVGDFFFMSSGQRLYAFATAGRLLLLLGLLFLRDDPLPGETRGRVERLTVRSLWVLVPLLLFFGVPVFSEALRQALRDFDFMKWALLLLLILTILLFEQALVPWDLFARGSRAERALAFALSSSVVMLFAFSMWRWMNQKSAAGLKDQAALGGFFLIPLLVALLFHAHRCLRGNVGRKGSFRDIPPPPRRIRVVFDGESHLIRLRRKRALRGLPYFFFGAALLAATWWLCHSLEVAGGGGPALLLLMILTVIGIVLVWLLMAGLSPTLTIQIRDGAARSASTFLGAAFGRPVWYRRIRFPVLVGQIQLTSDEKRWLSRVLGDERTVPKVELSLIDGKSGNPIRLELQVKNVGPSPVRLADVEEKESAPWTAEVNGHRTDIFFSRGEREALVKPGETRTFYPCLFAAAGIDQGSGFNLLLRCGSTGPRASTRIVGAGA